MKNLILFLAFFFPQFLFAQSENFLSNWNVTFHTGPYVGISRPMEKTMKKEGFRPRSGGLFGGNGVEQPMVSQQWPFQLGLEKQIKNSWLGKFMISTLGGEISGFSGQEGDLDMVYQMVTSSLWAGYYSKGRISRVAIGPALHFFSMEGHRLYIYTEPVKKTYTKIGLAVEAGFRFPTNSLIFFDYNSQFLWVGKEDLSIFTFKEEEINGQPILFEFNAGKQTFNYFTFNFGIGVRLGKLVK